MDNKEVLKNLFTESAKQAMVEVYEEGSVPKGERHILIDVSASETGEVRFQLASVCVEDDGTEDVLHDFYLDEETGITVYVDKGKTKYFTELEVDYKKVTNDDGEEVDTFIFRKKEVIDT
jgi:Fe-S cluster assembly iron-binding protein IscA